MFIVWGDARLLTVVLMVINVDDDSCFNVDWVFMPLLVFVGILGGYTTFGGNLVYIRFNNENN